jgi:hypothetical protein
MSIILGKQHTRGLNGLQGTLEGDNRKQWWVAEKDFGTGPFRWALTEGPAGPLLAVSGNFTLPTHPQERLSITVSLVR